MAENAPMTEYECPNCHGPLGANGDCDECVEARYQGEPLDDA